MLPGMDFVVPPFFSSSDGGAASFPRLPRRNLLPGKGGRRAWLIKVAGKRLADFRIVLCGEYSSTCRRVRWRFPQGVARTGSRQGHAFRGVAATLCVRRPCHRAGLFVTVRKWHAHCLSGSLRGCMFLLFPVRLQLLGEETGRPVRGAGLPLIY